MGCAWPWAQQLVTNLDSCLWSFPMCLWQIYSANLLDWRIATTVLVPNDGLSWEQSLQSTGYQYAGLGAAL